MALKFLSAAVAFAGLGSSAVCLEKTVMLPQGWKMLDGTPDASSPVRFSIALRQSKIGGLASKILSRSILGAADVDSLRIPAQKDVDDVTQWLSDNGITTAKIDKDWIHVASTVGQADKLLDMQLRKYSFADKNPVLRTQEYRIPDHLSLAIDFVHPLANFMTPEHEVLEAPPVPQHQSLQSLHRRDTACSPYTTLDCINKLYGIDYTPPDGKSSIRFAIAGFLEQWANYDDLQQNFAMSRPDLVQAGYNFSVELVHGGQNKQDPGTAGTEANLDVQFGMAVGFPTHVTYYSVGGRGEKLDDNGKLVDNEFNDNEPYLDFIRHLSNKPDAELPHVVSISYADDEKTVPKPYAIRVCNDIGLLTARGVSVLSGSGDGGSRGGRNAKCISNDGKNREMTIATFPASCPWVTSVGAVNNGQDPPWGADFSSGGFSDFFSRPKWQDKAVDDYVAALNGHLEGYYNPKMRAVPDISAVGTQFATVINGQTLMILGTSASTPVMAAMIALINDARVRKGKKSLGWLNEILYSQRVIGALKDVTTGQSFSCEFAGGNKPGGWPAAKGWDAITGIGVPGKFRDLMDVLVDL